MNRTFSNKPNSNVNHRLPNVTHNKEVNKDVNKNTQINGTFGQAVSQGVGIGVGAAVGSTMANGIINNVFSSNNNNSEITSQIDEGRTLNCSHIFTQFQDCVEKNFGVIEPCNNYFEILKECTQNK